MKTEFCNLLNLLLPAFDAGCYITIYTEQGIPCADLNLEAKSECILKSIEGEIMAFRRYDRVDKVETFIDLLSLVHDCACGRSYFSKQWHDLLLANGFDSPCGDL